MAAQRAPESAQVTSVDRLGFTLFLAVAVHAILILGIGFQSEEPAEISRTLEVTLAQFKSEQAPKQADFIAQHDQLGSGESEKKALPTTREQAVFQANESRPLAPRQQPLPVPLIAENPQPQPSVEASVDESQPDPETKTAKKQEVVITRAQAPRKVETEVQRDERKAAPPASGMATSLLARSLEIASLEARLDMYQQQHASQPRVRRLYSASTRKAFDAVYLDSWRRKVERVGNLNYPEEARRRQLYGNLRLLVVINPDGSLERIDVLKTSGYKVLDDAAIRIVRLAAPFAPFPPELRKHADQVEIIRTWKFERARFGINS